MCISHTAMFPILNVTVVSCSPTSCASKNYLIHYIFRALESKYFTYDQMELMDPAVMFAIPRLAIIRYIHDMYTCIYINMCEFTL